MPGGFEANWDWYAAAGLDMTALGCVADVPKPGINDWCCPMTTVPPGAM